MLREGEGKSVTRMMCLYGGRLPMRAAALSVVLFVAAACSTIPTPGSTPLPQIVATRLTAEVYGKLVVVDDCLRVNTNLGTSYLLVWPPGFDVGVNGETIAIADTITGEEADWRVGDMVWLGGGEVSNLDEETRQSVPRHCSGPYWVAGGLEMPGTMRNLVLFLEFEGAKVEFSDEATDHELSVEGKTIEVNEERVSVYEFVNEEAAEDEAALVSPDGLSIAREQGIRQFNWRGTPHLYHRGRLIVVYVNGNSKVRDWLEAFMGPQFAGGD
jgi:hypothetical protein